jgi:hypothetical protein
MAISPDGTKIAFARNDGDPEIYTIDANGTETRPTAPTIPRTTTLLTGNRYPSAEASSKVFRVGAPTPGTPALFARSVNLGS